MLPKVTGIFGSLLTIHTQRLGTSADSNRTRWELW
jgi:hypothetical protein